MRRVETENIKELAYLIEAAPTPFTSSLALHVDAFNIKLFIHNQLPTHESGAYLFYAQEQLTHHDIVHIQNLKRTKVLFITYSERQFENIRTLLHNEAFENARCVLVDKDNENQDTIEKILWFMLSKSSEKSLDISSHLPTHHRQKIRKPIRLTLTRRRLILAAVFILVAAHTLFLLPLAVSGVYIYQAGKSLEKFELAQGQKNLNNAQTFLGITHATYALAEPGLKFLFIANMTDNVIQILDNTHTFAQTAIDTSSIARSIFSGFLALNKTPEDIADMRKNLQQLTTHVRVLEKTSLNLQDQLSYNIPFIRDLQKRFETSTSYLGKSSLLVQNLPAILGDNAEKNYLVFFYNNMELRPGGGFIGSFAHVKVKNFTLQSFDVYDVYDADGQLTTHVRPPQAIRDILQQPHWFLRDSNFSPDFEENIKTAEFFVEKELNLSNFDGAFAMTTTALTYVLDAFGKVYVPDFNDTVTADNFYLKAQSQSEIGFFPGSNQKKSFLSTVGKTLMLKLEDASPAKLGTGIKQALDEKHMVLYMKDPEIESDIEKLGWSGKVLNPQCINTQNHCILNHIFPVEANLGVNKANFFVSKLMKLQTVIQPDNSVKNTLSIAFTNNSSPGVFPGGTYTNYFQTYLPVDASIQNVDIDGHIITDYELTKSGVFKILATRLDIPPQETHFINISYVLKEAVRPGYNTYQVVVQKQIGSFNSDFSFELQYPNNVIVTNQNFKSVAKNHSVLYNSNLSTNKVFVVEFVKQ